YYQSLQEEQSDFAESLMGAVKDPMILMAVLPDLIRMKGLGVYGDDLAKMIESMQPTQMQQARNGDKQEMSPAMVQQMVAQAQQAMQALNAHAKQLEQERDQLLMEKQAKTTELTLQKEIHEMDNAAKVEVATINASVKESIESIDAEVARIKHIADVLSAKFQLDHQSTENALDRAHEADLAQKQADQQQQAALVEAVETHIDNVSPETAEVSEVQAPTKSRSERINALHGKAKDHYRMT